MKNLYYKFLFFILFLLTFVVCNSATNVFAMTSIEAEYIIETFNLKEKCPSGVSYSSGNALDKMELGTYCYLFEGNGKKHFYFVLNNGDWLKIKDKNLAKGEYTINGVQELVGIIYG